jgi:hypothetical protein
VAPFSVGSSVILSRTPPREPAPRYTDPECKVCLVPVTEDHPPCDVQEFKAACDRERKGEREQKARIELWVPCEKALRTGLACPFSANPPQTYCYWHQKEVAGLVAGWNSKVDRVGPGGARWSPSKAR